jgi:hypothetical protein
MAENDIYNNQKRYENFISNIDKLTNKPTNRKQKYYCKNPINIQYFRILITYTEVKDLSYIRRLRVMQILKLITFITKKDLQECEREDINEIITFTHTTHKTVASKRDVIKDLKCIWKVLFPEKDQKGRIDESITPYVVRHLSRSVDKSKEKIRNDRLTYEEFQKIVHFFAHDKRIQAYLMLAFESLGRPQEILYTKIKDYEFHENFAKVWVCEHSKEGASIN